MGDDLAVEAAGLEKSHGTVRVLAGGRLNVPRGSGILLGGAAIRELTRALHGPR